MVRIILITVIYLFFPILIVSAFHKWKPLQKIGTVMMAYTVGIILSLTGMVQFEMGSAEADAFGQVQTWIMNLAVPIAIPLMLFNCDFKLWTKSLPKTFGTLIGGLASVLIDIGISNHRLAVAQEAIDSGLYEAMLEAKKQGKILHIGISNHHILQEIRTLSEKGYKEVTLLGQNVNSYLWGGSYGFPQLMADVAKTDRKMRVRFTTSHPKDLSDELLETMAAHPNICKNIHLPAQSGSSEVLRRMNRKYTRED